MNRTHQVPAASFDALAEGRGGPAAVTLLRDARLSRHLLLLRGLLERTPTGDSGRGWLTEAFPLLVRVERNRPDVVRDLLGQPQVGVWATRCLRDVVEAGGRRHVRDESWYLAALAASAAIRAGEPFEIALPLVDGSLVLPTLGRVLAPDPGPVPAQGAPVDAGPAGPGGGAVRHGAVSRVGGTGEGVGLTDPVGSPAALVRAESDGSGLRVRVCFGSAVVALPTDLGQAAPGWRPISRIAVNGRLSLRVLLDDVDPFRGGGDLVTAHQLEEGQERHWRDLVERCWHLLERHHPEASRELAVGLRALVPMARRAGGNRSATHSDAFGSVALSLPADAAQLGAVLVHEFQHSKLSALLDLVPLADGVDPARYYAPWRNDPRPAGALLQGVYAHLAVTDFWRRQRWQGGDDPERATAHFEFALWLVQTHFAARVLATSPALNAAGRHFLTTMSRRLSRWRAEPIPVRERALAVDAAAEHRAQWRLRNLRTDPVFVNHLAEEWAAGGTAPARLTPETELCPPPLGPDSPRAGLRRAAVRDPDLAARRLSRSQDGNGMARDAILRVELADIAGEDDAAKLGYRNRLLDSPRHRDSWVGLGLVERRSGDPGLAEWLLCRPELVHAVYLRIRQLCDGVTDPISVARWLFEGRPGPGYDEPLDMGGWRPLGD
ncbi:HEXXH motif domain-containing protein [Actinoalloteichus spitiensis]|uniref:HEXXH motif domain-containing protein n=1 Tax=Actinoalloteichus spitiensis TaxID=252394 RepID=UPI000381A329|nr:HEXXH motif domain-containing protein [Actinoalloteichus spitiensis]